GTWSCASAGNPTPAPEPKNRPAGPSVWCAARCSSMTTTTKPESRGARAVGAIAVHHTSTTDPHLNDSKKSTSSAGLGGHKEYERKAAVPSTTIEELEAGTQFDLEAAKRRRAKAKLEIQSILDKALQEGRAALNVDEDTRVSELLTERNAAGADVDTITT